MGPIIAFVAVVCVVALAACSGGSDAASPSTTATTTTTAATSTSTTPVTSTAPTTPPTTATTTTTTTSPAQAIRLWDALDHDLDGDGTAESVELHGAVLGPAFLTIDGAQFDLPRAYEFYSELTIIDLWSDDGRENLAVIDWGVEDDPQWLVTDYVDGELVFTEAVWAFFGTDLPGDGSIHTGFMNCGLTYDFVSTFDPTTMQPTTLETITGEENPELCVG